MATCISTLDVAQSNNYASLLTSMARIQPDTMAVACPHGRDGQGRVAYTHYTYRQVEEESERLARGFCKLGISEGVRVVFMVKPGLDFLTVAFALFKSGAVIVGIDPGMGPKNVGKCMAEANPSAFIGIPAAHIARRLFGWAKGLINTSVVVGPKLSGMGKTVSLQEVRNIGDSNDLNVTPQIDQESAAAIVFTSGSTGVPKGVLYSHGTFFHQVNALRDQYGIERGEVDLATFAHFSFYAPALGLTTVIADMDFMHPARVNPKKIVEAIDNFAVTNIFGSPALLKRLGKWGKENNIKLPSLRRVISAGAPVSHKVLQNIAVMLSPEVQVFTPYGSTEALPVSSIGSNELLKETIEQTNQGKGVCVGYPCKGVQINIIRITDDVIDQWSDDLKVKNGEIGEIVVLGDLVTKEYDNLPHLTALAKIRDNRHRIYHRMGDLGYLDDKGRLWFCGRKSQRVETDDGVYFTIPCEAIFNTHVNVYRSALVPLPKHGKIHPALCVELEHKVTSKKRNEIKSDLLHKAQSFEHTRAIKDVLFCTTFPTDARHNAKIVREKLALLIQRKLT